MPASSLARATCLLLAAVAFCGCAGSASHSSRQELDRAIATYIAGDYEGARKSFRALTTEASSEDVRREAFLYLGRSHMALAEYQEARDAFMTGKLMGGGVEFDEFIAEAERYLGTSGTLVRLRSRVTRSELADVLYSLFLKPEATPGDAAGAVPVETAVRMAGLMDVMPDGDFHGDAIVTAAAFHVIAKRTATWLGVPAGLVDDAAGYKYEDAVKSPVRNVDGARVVTVLEVLAGATRES